MHAPFDIYPFSNRGSRLIKRHTRVAHESALLPRRRPDDVKSLDNDSRQSKNNFSAFGSAPQVRKQCVEFAITGSGKGG